MKHDLTEMLLQKKIFITPLGRMQQEFEYIFTDFQICGYIDQKCSESVYNGRPVKSLAEALGQNDIFIIICENKNRSRREQLERYHCNYRMNFCFAEDLFFLLDYDLQRAAGSREIVICTEEDNFIDFIESRKPDLLLDTIKHGETFHGMEIVDPMDFEAWGKYFTIVTVDEPAQIYSTLEGEGLALYKDYMWYRDLAEHALPDDRKIAYYGCGYVAAEILKRQERHIAKAIAPDGLTACDKEKQYVVLVGTAFDKVPILENQGYEEIKDFAHLDYVSKMEDLKPSDLLMETMAAPMVEQPHCDLPFELAWIGSDGEVHGCVCPGWVQWDFGNIRYQKCSDVWNSIYAKIFRLSIVNRTFCFCKKNYCPQCDPFASSVEDAEFQMEYKVGLYPQIVDPCIDDSCNLFCQSCRATPRHAQGKKLQEIKFMAKRLVDEKWLEQAEELIIAGAGEVFYSEIYQNLLYEVEQKRNKVYILSNGNLFGAKELAMLLNCYECVEIEISMDAASEGTYQKLRRGGNWSRLMQNLERLSEEKKKGHIGSLTINMTVQRENYREIPEFIKLGEKLCADTIAIRPLVNWGTYSEEEYRENSMISHENNWISDELREVLEDPLLERASVDYSWFQKRL